MAQEKPFTNLGSNRQSPTVDDDATLLVGAGIDTSTAGPLTIGENNATNVVVIADIEFQGTTTFPGPVEPLNLPLEFSIDSVPTTTDVTAANLNELTGGGDTTLHTHSGVPIEFEINSVATSTNVTAANLNSLTAGTFAGMIQKRRVTVGVTGSGAEVELTTAGLSQIVNIGAVLPANAMVLGVDIGLTAFSGGGASAALADIGTTGDDDAIVANANLFAAAVDGKVSDMPAGIAPFKLFVSGGAQLKATITSDVNVSTLTAGQAVITVSFVALP